MFLLLPFLLSIVPVLAVYKRARANSRNGAAWALGAGLVIVGIHFAGLMVIGFVAVNYDVGPPNPHRPDRVTSSSLILVVEGIAILLSFIVNGVALYGVTRPNEKVRIGLPPPPPSFDDKI